ncbi:Ribonuclease VapC1 [Gemmata obscuriglobus]|uniref:PIN domain-containing protein n=1 Tax=Gemmata obscuriglobus TaxID=114 RepID=A0A2Z3GRU8_9BACT|nr:type II toxin-antitoxin system VapC family toxin [Gemmata obscuriglobus]AWM36048.1 PIN domain-containing protein [Gemmata obscuriglobus]QEG31377.1 Ribonuclease VapC1 [Gemmata obscuriglobus]VTS10717.1 Ribonuclease VapC1 OS=Microcystis aeruginosa SPC777 GN=MAESPC_04921 PE=4 SV=1: PIN [Gemmata obscuriglobus UQM 2246]
MALYLLDTTTLTLLQRRHTRVTAAVVAHATDTLGVTTVNVEEVVGGWFALLRRAKTTTQEGQAAQALADAMGLLARFAVLPTTEAALDRFDRLVKLKLNVGKMDLKMAAVALEVGATVVTNNARDFARVPGLSWEDWAV